jgi:hypothetical protein
MPLTEKETKMYQEIVHWHNQLERFDKNKVEMTIDKYLEQAIDLLPEDVQQQLFSTLDHWLFHLHAIIQGSQWQSDAKERILTSGRVFHSKLSSISQMQELSFDQLQFIAEQQISRHRVYSLVQGGLSGTGGTMLLLGDLPAIAIINLRVVQLISMAYGFDVNTPFEMMTSLKVFHSATLPERMQKQAWEDLMMDLEQAKGNFYFYEGNEEITNAVWMEQPIKQLFKALGILLLKKKTVGNIPLLSMAIGAGTNYQLTKKVTEFAHKYYQMRYLNGKKE